MGERPPKLVRRHEMVLSDNRVLACARAGSKLHADVQDAAKSHSSHSSQRLRRVESHRDQHHLSVRPQLPKRLEALEPMGWQVGHERNRATPTTRCIPHRPSRMICPPCVASVESGPMVNQCRVRRLTCDIVLTRAQVVDERSSEPNERTPSTSTTTSKPYACLMQHATHHPPPGRLC